MGQGGGAGGDANGACIAWGIVWFIFLLIAFWIAGICFFLYIILNMFAACVEGLNPVCEALMKGIQLTGFCAKHMVQGTPVNEALK